MTNSRNLIPSLSQSTSQQHRIGGELPISEFSHDRQSPGAEVVAQERGYAQSVAWWHEKYKLYRKISCLLNHFVYKMVYCSVACCTNGNHSHQDLSNFAFPSNVRLHKWLKFCHRADKSLHSKLRKQRQVSQTTWGFAVHLFYCNLKKVH